MINAAIFLVYEELLSRYEWKTNHSTTAVVNTLKNLHVYLVTTQITVRYSVSAASQSPSILNITSRHFSFHLAKWSFGYFSGAPVTLTRINISIYLTRWSLEDQQVSTLNFSWAVSCDVRGRNLTLPCQDWGTVGWVISQHLIRSYCTHHWVPAINNIIQLYNSLQL